MVIKTGGRNDTEALDNQITMQLMIAFQLNDQLTELKLSSS